MSDPESVSLPPAFTRPPRYPQSLDLLHSADQAIETLVERSGMAEYLRESFEDRRDELIDAVVPLVVDRLWTEYIRRLGRAEARQDWALLREAILVEVEKGEEGTSVTLKELPEAAFEDPTGHIRKFAHGAVSAAGIDEWAHGTSKLLVSDSSSKTRKETGPLGSTSWSPEEAQHRILERAAGDEELIRKVGNRLGEAISQSTLSLIKKWARESIGSLDLFTLELLFGVRETSPPPSRRDTPEFAPDPFQGDDGLTFVAADPFSSAAGRALVETPDGTVSDDNKGEWGSDSTGHPIRVEQLRGQYSGRVTFRVQAHGETDPTAVDAEMGWAMLQEMDMGAVWLHALLLAHASAPGRRGERKQIRIPRTRLERLLGFRSRNWTKWERAEQIKEYMDQIRSVFVQFQNVERHGDRIRFRHEMNATPLWSARIVAEGEKDLFSGQEWSDWHMEAREGMWAEQFLHEDGDQWAPLPKEWFEKIDRRGSDWGQRLAILCLFLFRANREQGGRVTLSASRMLRACGVNLDAERDKDERYDLKQRLSSALDDLYYRYEMPIQDGDVNTSKIEGRSYWTTWKNQTVTIDPPEKIDRNLLSGSKPERAPLPDSRPGRWGKREIKALLNKLGWTQKRLADKLPVSTQSVSHYVNDRRNPTDEVRRALDRIEARHC